MKNNEYSSKHVTTVVVLPWKGLGGDRLNVVLGGRVVQTLTAA